MNIFKPEDFYSLNMLIPSYGMKAIADKANEILNTHCETKLQMYEIQNQINDLILALKTYQERIQENECSNK